jgi:hypothetical protein
MNLKMFIAFWCMLIGTGMMYAFSCIYLCQFRTTDVALYWSTAFMIMSVAGNGYFYYHFGRQEKINFSHVRNTDGK